MVPQFIKDEFEAYLECGILAHGFLRLTCDTCARDTLVAFSCKRRGNCPSCGTRRMAETAADLVDNILPQVPVRQWVLSFPIPLRSLFAIHPDLITPVLRLIHRAVNSHLWPRAGRKVLILVGGAVGGVGYGERCEPLRSRELCASAEGFSLHAGVHCEANDRQGIEQLCRYITRPAISNERLAVNRDGNVILKLKTAWRNGTTHIVLTPMEFMQRLAALVPRPRLHLIRFHSVLAPNAKLRSQVVPVPPQKTTAGEGDCAHQHSKPVRMTWARLLKRVFDINVERCACGGKLKLIAVIEEPAVIEKILTHLGLSPQPPPIAPARKRAELFEWA